MRIALLTHEFPLGDAYTGGIGTHFAAIARAFVRHGHTVDIFTPGVKQPPNRTPEGYTLHHLGDPVGGPLWACDSLVWGARFWRAARSAGPFDFVLAPEFGAPAALLAYTPGVRVVTSLATSLWQVRSVEPRVDRRLRAALRDRIQDKAEQLQTEHSFAVIAVSEMMLQSTLTRWSLDGSSRNVIPNFLSQAELNRVHLSSVPPANHIAFVGRVCDWKGADVLLRAMPKVWAVHPDTTVTLAGRVDHLEGGAVSDFIAAHVPTRNRAQIHLAGHLDRKSVLELLAGASLAVFPSRFEAFGLAALEARYLGRPIIVTSGNGFADFCNPGADCLEVPPGDPEQLADAMNSLLDSPELRDRLGSRAAESARGFTDATLGDRLVAYFEGLQATRAAPVRARGG